MFRPRRVTTVIVAVPINTTQLPFEIRDMMVLGHIDDTSTFSVVGEWSIEEWFRIREPPIIQSTSLTMMSPHWIPQAADPYRLEHIT